MKALPQDIIRQTHRRCSTTRSISTIHAKTTPQANKLHTSCGRHLHSATLNMISSPARQTNPLLSISRRPIILTPRPFNASHSNRLFKPIHSSTLSTNNIRGFADAAEREDYYQTLGVDRNATPADIKRAFYRKAKEFHPDANPSPDAKDKFSVVNEAYQVLSNQDKRAHYDRFGHDGPPQHVQDLSGQELQDIFAQLFGSNFSHFGDAFGDMGGERSSGPQMGQEMIVEQALTFMEAVNGSKKMMQVKRYDHCEACQSSGVQPGSTPTKCHHCQGTGFLRQSNGFMTFQQTCWHCQGLGESRQNCDSCKGQGLVMASTQLEVAIPAGVDDGMRVRIASQGHAGRFKGPRGHIWVLCRVRADDRFERHGSDVVVDVDVPLHVAVLGGNVDFPTLNGEAELKVKPGTQPGSREILRGKGIRDPANGLKGHQYLHLNVQIPTELSDRQRELMEEFAKESESSETKVDE